VVEEVKRRGEIAGGAPNEVVCVVCTIERDVYLEGDVRVKGGKVA